MTTTIDYDAWERARHVVISGPDLLIDEQLDYDATGRLVRHIRKQDNATVTKNYVYDVVGRPLSETIDGVSGGGSETTSTTYDAAGRTIITNHPGGSITTARLDGFGRVISSETTTGGDPIVDHFAYDLDDNVVFATDLQTATASAYDAHGNQIGSLLIDGVKTEAVMNAWGRPTTIRQTTSAGAVLREATFQYTPAGQLQSMEMSSAGSSTRSATLTWDGAGRTTGMSAAGRATRRTYDNAGRLLQAEKGAGSAQGITDRFDGAEFSGHTGRLPQAGKRLEKGSSAYAMAMAYNTAADVTAHAVGNLQWEQSFDQDGNLIAARHPNRPPSTFDYDSRGFLKVETLPDGSLNQYTRHPTGALTSYLDPSSEVTETKTDLIGRPTRRDFRDGTSEVVVWEGRRVKSITDRQGRIQTFVYNAKGQIHQITGVSGVVLDTIEYDDAGRITKWSTPDAIIEYRDLDGEGRPAETVQTRLRNGAEVDKYTQRHTWNVHGERTSWTMPTYQGFSSMNPWTTSVTQQYDAAGNLTRIERAVSGGVGAASVLLDAEYRNERRPNRRTITTAAGETIDRQYGYDAASGLMIRMEATAGGEVVAGSEVAHDGLQKSQARLLGLSGGARFNAWSYDARNRLMWSALALDGEATPNGETLSSGDFRGALNRTRLTPADPPSLHFEEDPSGGHKLSVMQRGNVIEEFTFNGGERREDGRFIYAYDGKGRLVSATLKDAVSPRRARYFYDGRGRMVGRRLEYVPVVPIGTIDESHWKLEDRPSVLAGEQLPADSTFVWDPMDDQMVAIFAAGASGSVSAGPNGGLVRQFIHGGLRYDDPLEVAIADSGAPGGVKRLYPIFDEAGSKSLQVVVSEQGKIVSRAVAGGAYGEDEAVLTGPAIDKIAVTAKKDDAGNVVAIDVLVRSTEDLDVATLASGFRLAVVDGGGQALRTTTAAVSLHDRATAKWTLTRAEWDAFAGSSGTLSVAATSTARAATWGDEVGMLAAPEWASETRPVFSSAALPVEVRESLANLSSWLASIPASGTATATLYEVPTLYALATPRDPEIPISDAQLLLVSAAFHAQPFHDPFTRKNYVRARWFDPQSGTWLTPDPRGYRDSSNLYAYCGNDPVNCSDPTGEAGEDGEDDGWGTAAVSFVKSAAKTVAIGVAITATVAAAGISTPVIVAVGSVALVSSAAYNGYQRYQAGHADSVLEAVVMGVGDATGINTAIEAATCREIGTGEELSRSECAERWGTVAGLAVTGGLARPVARRANAAAAPAREAVKNAISRSLARPPPGAAAAAMARRVTRPVQRPVVLGETMGTRVRPVARAIGARTFKPRSTNPARWEANQRRWIRKQIASGRKIYDIGKHRGRPVDPRTGSNRSEYYRMEVDELTRAGYHREFVKWVSAYVDDGFGNMVRKNFRLYEWVR
ncbi:MAG TPA: RHS repeat-associated core domain-containing protein [Thermoanaerobaculia bacterium]